MPSVSIKVLDKEETGPLWEDLTEPISVAQLIRFGVVEGGMASGKSSVVLLFEHDGKKFVAETSGEIFKGMAAALTGAEMRFEDKKAGNGTTKQ